MNSIQHNVGFLPQKKRSVFTFLFYVVYLLIMFSGSTVIKDYLMFLFFFYFVFCFCMALTKQGNGTAIFNRNRQLQFPFLLTVAFSMYLVFQLSFAYVPTIVRVYIRRYLIFAFTFVFVPKYYVYEKAIKYSKIYSIAVAVSIIIMTAISGSNTGGLVGDYHAGGMMMSIACIIFLIEYYEKQNNRLNLIWLMLCVIGLLISGKRMFALIVFAAFFLIFRNTKQKNRHRRMFGGILLGLVGIVLIIAFVPAARETLNRVITLSGELKSVTSGRNVLWEKAWIAFKDNVAFGIGFGAFEKYFANHYNIPGIQAFLTHNIYIGLLAETGLVGTVIYISFMTSSLVVTWRLRRPVFEQDDPSMRYVYLYSLLMQYWFIIYGLTGNGIYDVSETFFYFSAIAMMISLKYELNRRKGIN